MDQAEGRVPEALQPGNEQDSADHQSKLRNKEVKALISMGLQLRDGSPLHFLQNILPPKLQGLAPSASPGVFSVTPKDSK